MTNLMYFIFLSVDIKVEKGKLAETLYEWIKKFGLNENWTDILLTTSLIIILLLVSFLADLIAKKFLSTVVKRIIAKSKSKWDDSLSDHKVFTRLGHVIPALIVFFGIETALRHQPKMVNLIQDIIYIYLTILVILVIQGFLKAMNDMYQHTPYARNRPIKGYLQLINIFVVIVALILTYSHISGNAVEGILAGLGAMAAVIMLVFKDTILGLTASIQLSANQMLNIGDWITMPSHGADGEVLEITLNTVKVQNWDKTITTIPTYAMVSESYSNWRGMEESGGRRIKRSINIDMRSVKFCTPELIEELSKVHYLKKYITQKNEELSAFNQEHHIDETIPVNGRRMTNLGVFRKYLENYLKGNPKINKNMTFLVRQLQPNEKGIAIEIYVFSKDQEWANYEEIQSDIFDHVLAAIPEFELRVFQNPTGYDFERLEA